MPEEQITTIQIPVPARDALKEVADFYRRSMSSQAAWMFKQELAQVRLLKASQLLLDALDNDEPTA